MTVLEAAPRSGRLPRRVPQLGRVRAAPQGADRPLVGEEDRAAVLRALGCVDAVLVFDEDTPERVLARLRPDVGQGRRLRAGRAARGPARGELGWARGDPALRGRALHHGAHRGGRAACRRLTWGRPWSRGASGLGAAVAGPWPPRAEPPWSSTSTIRPRVGTRSASTWPTAGQPRPPWPGRPSATAGCPRSPPRPDARALRRAPRRALGAHRARQPPRHGRRRARGAPHLERASGRVVTVASTLGFRVFPDATAYCASKFGVVGFTRALAAELAGRVGVTMLVPGGMHVVLRRARSPVPAGAGRDAQRPRPRGRGGGLRALPTARVRAARARGDPGRRALLAVARLASWSSGRSAWATSSPRFPPCARSPRPSPTTAASSPPRGCSSRSPA